MQVSNQVSDAEYAAEDADKYAKIVFENHVHEACRAPSQQICLLTVAVSH